MIRTLPTFRRGTRWGDLRSTELQAVSDGVKQSLEWVEAAKRLHLRGLPRFKHPTAGEPGAIRRFVYTGRMGADHLVCTDPLAEEPTQVLVAKPQELRRSTYHGLEVDGVLYTYPEDVSQSMTRIAKRMSDEYTENHHIRPFYVTGRTIVALGFTPEQLGLRVGEVDVIWEDATNASRAWTRTR